MRLLEREKSKRYANAEQVIEDLARCADAPKNGRGELSRVLAARFPDAGQVRPSNAHDAPRTKTGPTAPNRPPVPIVSPTTLGSAAGQTSAPQTRRHPRWLLPVLGIATAGVTATVVAVLVGRSTASAPTERSAAAHASPDASAPGPDALEMAEVHIATDPAGARVIVDEHALGASPVTARVRLGGTLAVRAELDGFVTSVQVIRAEAARRDVVLALAPVPPPPDAGVVDAPPVAKQTVTRRTPPVEPPTAPPSTKTKPEPRGSVTIKPDDVGGD